MAVSKFDKKFCVLIIISQFSLVYSSSSSLKSNASLNLKYILLWSNNAEPIKSHLREGDIAFTRRRCPSANCYVSSNRQLLKDVSDFDVVLFHGRELPVNASLLPQSRSPHQKYVYAMMESSHRFPVCNKMYNNYFNWTWTYKLNSDEYYGYISIRDKEGKVIGPTEEMHWEKVEAMMPINDTLKAKLSTKKIAAAWFVSNCRTLSRRELIAKKLQAELAKYNMRLDIFGKCGNKACPRSSRKYCLRLLETNYYFYLAFENSFADDYVTEKLLYPLTHYTVPVVYGSANYTRFMPEGIYLSAQQSKIKELAEEMVAIINDKQRYYNFFKLHNHYSYHELGESRDTDGYCRLCALINNREKVLRTTVYEDFSQWWSPQQCHGNVVGNLTVTILILINYNIFWVIL